MFSNTLTLTINAVAKVMTRNNQDNFGSVYEFISADGQETIKMQIRHTKDKSADGLINRHNVYIERTILASPTAAKKYWSVTITLRDLIGSSPADLVHLSVAASTLLAALDDTLVVGEN